MTVVLVSGFYIIPRFLGGLASLAIMPVVSIESWLAESSASLPSYLRDRQSLLEELEERDKRLAAEGGRSLTISRLQKENDRLRDLLGASSTPRIAAGVIARPPSTPYDVLVLDQGSTQGVVEAAPVFIGRDQVIGYVSAVYEKTSIVTLVTSPDIESTVYIIGPNIYTTAVGIGSGVLRVGVPQGIPLTPGDLVVIPSFDAGVFGQIATVDSSETRPEQYGYVTNATPLQSLRWVSVGTESLKSRSFEEVRAVVDRVRAELTTVTVPEGVLIELPAEAASSTETATTTANEPVQ